MSSIIQEIATKVTEAASGYDFKIINAIGKDIEDFMSEQKFSESIFITFDGIDTNYVNEVGQTVISQNYRLFINTRESNIDEIALSIVQYLNVNNQFVIDGNEKSIEVGSGYFDANYSSIIYTQILRVV